MMCQLRSVTDCCHRKDMYHVYSNLLYLSCHGRRHHLLQVLAKKQATLQGVRALRETASLLVHITRLHKQLMRAVDVAYFRETTQLLCQEAFYEALQLVSSDDTEQGTVEGAVQPKGTGGQVELGPLRRRLYAVRCERRCPLPRAGIREIYSDLLVPALLQVLSSPPYPYSFLV